MSRSRLSVIVVNWNTRRFLERCLASLDETARGLDVETIVVDNGSADGSAAMVEERFPRVHLLRQSENLGFSKAVNLGLPSATGDLVLLLNSDTVLLPGTLEQSASRMEEDPSIDVLGCRLIGGDGGVQTSCGLFPSLHTLWWQSVFVLVLRVFGPGTVRWLSRRARTPLMPVRDLVRIWDPGEVRDVDWVSGAFLMTRRSVVERVGGLDESFWLFGEDMDWCWRVKRAGGRVVYFGRASIIHVGGGSTAAKLESDLRHYRASLRLYAKHRGRGQAIVYRTILAAAAAVRITALVLTRLVGCGSSEFRTRLAREWGLLKLRT